MGRHTGPSCKLCRREGTKLFLKGEKCATAKCPFAKRGYAPGQHGQAKKRNISEFGLRLREKQKARRIYGISERQFRGYFEHASKSKGSTGEKLLELLERRLDNVVWRAVLAASRAEARQIIRNGHILINGKKTDIPSFMVKEGDKISVKEKSHGFIKKIIEGIKDRSVANWISIDPVSLEGSINSIPKRDDVDALIEERLIVEFYSR